MRITITSADNNPTTGQPDIVELAGTGKYSVANFRINGRPAFEVAEGLRWSEIQMRRRYNRRNTISFSVTRTWGTVILAQMSILQLEADIPHYGTLTIITHGGGKRYYMANAAVSVVDAAHIGVTTIHSFQVDGGVIYNSTQAMINSQS